MKMLIGLCVLVLALLSSSTAELQKDQGDTSPQDETTPRDCTEIKKLKPDSRSGVYEIQPAASKFKVYCEMRPDGGWTVIQKRTGPAVSFTFKRNWASYKSGFGHLDGDLWLGLKWIYWLTKSKMNILRVDLWDDEKETAFAQYERFRLGSPRLAYPLHVGRYTGTAGDGIHGTSSTETQNGFGFSTPDRDNDGCSPCIFFDIAVNECARNHGGGWWFGRCGSANLNGDYHAEENEWGLQWGSWRDKNKIKATRMMIKSE